MVRAGMMATRVKADSLRIQLPLLVLLVALAGFPGGVTIAGPTEKEPEPLNIVKVDTRDFPRLRVTVAGTNWSDPELVTDRKAWKYTDGPVSGEVLGVDRLGSAGDYASLMREPYQRRSVHYPLHLMILTNVHGREEAAGDQVLNHLLADKKQHAYRSGVAVNVWASNLAGEFGLEGQGSWLGPLTKERVAALLDNDDRLANASPIDRVSDALEKFPRWNQRKHWNAVLVVLDRRDFPEAEEKAERDKALRTVEEKAEDWVEAATTRRIALSFLAYGIPDRLEATLGDIARKTGGRSEFLRSVPDEDEGKYLVRDPLLRIVKSLHDHMMARVVTVTFSTSNCVLAPTKRERLSLETAAGEMPWRTRFGNYTPGSRQIVELAEDKDRGYRDSLAHMLEASFGAEAGYRAEANFQVAKNYVANYGTDRVKDTWDDVLGAYIEKHGAIAQIRVDADHPDYRKGGTRPYDLCDLLFSDEAREKALRRRAGGNIRQLLADREWERAWAAARELWGQSPPPLNERENCQKAARAYLDHVASRSPRDWSEEFALVKEMTELGLFGSSFDVAYRPDVLYRTRIDDYVASRDLRGLVAIDRAEEALRKHMEGSPAVYVGAAKRRFGAKRLTRLEEIAESKVRTELEEGLEYYAILKGHVEIPGHEHWVREVLSALHADDSDGFPVLLTGLAKNRKLGTDSGQLIDMIAIELRPIVEARLKDDAVAGTALARGLLDLDCIDIETRRDIWCRALEDLSGEHELAMTVAESAGHVVPEKPVGGDVDWMLERLGILSRTFRRTPGLHVRLRILEEWAERLDTDRDKPCRVILESATGLGPEDSDVVWRAWNLLTETGRQRTRDPQRSRVIEAAMHGLHLDAFEALLVDSDRDGPLERRVLALARMHFATCRLATAGWELGLVGGAERGLLRDVLSASNRGGWGFSGVRETSGRIGDRPQMIRKGEGVEFHVPFRGAPRKLVFRFEVKSGERIEDSHEEVLRAMWLAGVPRLLQGLLTAVGDGRAEVSRPQAMKRLWAGLAADPKLGSGRRIEYVRVRWPGEQRLEPWPRSSAKVLSEVRGLGESEFPRDLKVGDGVPVWNGQLTAYPFRFGDAGVAVVAVRWK